MKFYTLWKKELNSTDAILLDSEPAFKTKHNAFKRARKLADRLIYGRGDKILVRHIELGNDMCKEWEFEATA